MDMYALAVTACNMQICDVEEGRDAFEMLCEVLAEFDPDMDEDTPAQVQMWYAARIQEVRLINRDMMEHVCATADVPVSHFGTWLILSGSYRLPTIRSTMEENSSEANILMRYVCQMKQELDAGECMVFKDPLLEHPDLCGPAW